MPHPMISYLSEGSKNNLCCSSVPWFRIVVVHIDLCKPKAAGISMRNSAIS